MLVIFFYTNFKTGNGYSFIVDRAGRIELISF